MTPAPQAWFLVGPTASGKTEIAHALALRSGACVLCADSMTVYRGMDVGTAKPDAAQRAEVRYFGLDLRTPAEPFSVADFVNEARAAARAAAAAGRPLIVVGGSGLYVRCLLEGLRDGAPADAAIRAEADQLLAAGGVAALQRRVQAVAPAHYAALADPANPRRLVRAWEQAAAGAPAERTWSGPRATLTGLCVPAAELDARIAARAAAMFRGGLLDEVRALREEYPHWSPTAAQAIGYAEALTHLGGRSTVEQAVERTRVRTRQLARRQLTWFRHQAEVDWVERRDGMSTDEAAEAVEASWRNHGIATLRI